MSLPLTDRALADARYPELFDGTGTTFNILTGQVQGELDVYFLSGGGGGLSTTGQVVATTGLQVLGGTSSFDGGLAITDGAGTLTASNFVDGSGNQFSSLFNGSGGNVLYASAPFNPVTPGNLVDSDSFGNFADSTLAVFDIANMVSVFPNLFNGSGGSVLQATFASRGFNTNDPVLVLSSGQIASDDGSPVALDWSHISNTPTELAGYGITDTIPLAYDSGWVANADAGDKTVVIGSTASLTTIATALNLVSSGAGTALLNIAQKVKAIEAALATSLIPNA